MSTIKNSEAGPVTVSLMAVGARTIPIPLALRMAKLRQNLETHLKAVEEVRRGIFQEIAGEATEIKPGTPEMEQYAAAFGELMEQDYEVGEPFVLYQQGDEFSWARNMKTKIGELEPNTLFGLLPLLEIVDVSAPALVTDAA